ncbi:MAG TPA: hypothetical protein VGE27_10230 [Gemmatimonas sp.]|uniref:hypothetical protein n=1 Tax=Gemmatimonas sp. TaxID=1962908 RepID=UPI002ED9A765
MRSSTIRLTSAARAAALFAAVAFVGACNSLTEREQFNDRFGAISISARNASTTQGRASASMIVFDASSVSIPNSLLQQSDQCVYASVDTTTSTPRGQLRAGDAIAMTVGAQNLSLPFSSTLVRYATPEANPFTYTRGDEATVTVPGEANGFPASNISVKLAEPIIPEPIPALVSGQVLPIRWNGTNDSTAAIILSLRYANPATSSYANEQIYCALRDDGSVDIPVGGVATLLASPANRRSMVLTRWRTSEKVLNETTLLHIVSTIDTTVAVP